MTGKAVKSLKHYLSMKWIYVVYRRVSGKELEIWEINFSGMQDVIAEVGILIEANCID